MRRRYAVEFREALLDDNRKPYAFLGRIYTRVFPTAAEAKAFAVVANSDPKLSQPFPNVYAVAVYVGNIGG
jgi:hypothetical protein